jgi:hypothetical protein
MLRPFFSYYGGKWRDALSYPAPLHGIDYSALADWCTSLPGQVIVCENDGATWLPFRPHASVRTTRRTSRSAEAVWVSGVPRDSLAATPPR